ncbi:penicillin-binding protein 2 [Pelagovum pacificum]|uniref:Penicillin-binding protein 2 n=1 Tax=Pelagovum pacificum TaxID=2588711 RepID=A0A5C5G9K7_9RHOB|nr:penicillin-binding protein 2 [Pelagovum pacificum]QQA42352.1 penicillin-binding protein 2 [Pelagovum pacificum]TNY31436.1 penicillin-binding protein 2 [Pelagovum pacificum]
MKRPTKDIQRSARTVTRRGLVLGAAQLGLMSVLGWRMHSMQVDQADEFRLLAEENRVNLRLVPPARGLIFDRNGQKLAENEQNYRIVIVREDAGDVDEALARLARIIPLEQDAIDRAKEEMARRSPFVPVTIMERVPWEDVARVTVNTPALPGISAEVGLSRFYGRGGDMAHVVGYVGPVSDYDLTRGYLAEDEDPLLEIPRFQVGKTGVEARLEHTLRGTAGTKRIEVNAVGRVMRELGRQDGDKGKDIQLTIDANLQEYLHARLDGESASAVVLDLEDGDIRAIGSTPSFDPNLFVRGISVADWSALNEDTYRPLASKAVQDAYPPGSTFKMVTALAALEAGEIDTEETVYCPGHLDVSDVRFHCWRRGGHGNINLHESLKQSCDVYYYDVGQRVGIDKIAEMAKKLGLGMRHEIPMSAVTEGIAPNKEWKRGFNGEEWRIGDTVNASIGQGYVLTSPVQLAVMVGRIATGRALTPRLIRTIDGVPQPSGAGEPLGLNENNLRRVRESMNAVVNHSRGTAYSSRILADEFQMSGKTGTSQVRRITAEERAAGVTSNADLPWERRDHGLFVCFAPANNPKYAVAVVVEHGGGGGAASPLARDIMLQALYNGTPPLEAYPSAVRGRIHEQQEQMEQRAAARNGNDRA